MTAATTPRLHVISLADIAIIERARKDLGDIASLSADLKLNGQLVPGIVRPPRPGEDVDGADWVLVAGERRYRALALAGITSFLAIDKGDLPPREQLILELTENLFRKDFEAFEEDALRKRIHDMRVEQAAEQGRTWTLEDTAKELGTTKGTMSKAIAVAKAVEENPGLKSIGSRIGILRQVDYERRIADRTQRVGHAALGHVKSRLVTADMRDFLRAQPTASIDLVFTDFPFGIDYKFSSDHARGKYLEDDTAENLRDLLTDVIPQMIRVCKPTGWLALMMGSTNYEFLRSLVEECCSTHFEYRTEGFKCCPVGADRNEPCTFLTAEDPEWIWYRPNSRNPSMHPELHAQNQYEKLCVVNRGEAVMVQKNLGNVLVHDAVYSDRIHEMQRPHSLCLDVIHRLTVGGERVADFCFGSGSALAAAAELQRDFLGCDINPANLGPAVAFVSEHVDRIANV